MKKYTVYKHINKINKKTYIGITCQVPIKRWNYGYGYKRNKLFFRAILKYGWDNFNHEIIKDNLSEKEAKQLEIEIIKKTKSNNKNYGYNITNGGEGTNGYVPSIETINKLKGRTPWNKGKKTNEITKQKLSIAHKGKKLTEEHKSKIGRYGKQNAKSIPVICIETQEYFESMNLAAKKYGLELTNIAKVCRGERNTTGNMHWEYYR